MRHRLPASYPNDNICSLENRIRQLECEIIHLRQKIYELEKNRLPCPQPYPYPNPYPYPIW
jgi:hypothetical protein